MKKFVIFALVIFALFAVSNAFAWNIVNSKQGDKDEIEYFVKCDAGGIIHVLRNTRINKYFVGGSMYDSMEEAVSAGCN